MRISDWSSDVCSSDLLTIPVAQGPTEIPNRLGLACAFTHGGINFLSRTAFLGPEFCKQLLGSRNVDYLDPILFHRRKRIIKLLEGCQPHLVACTALKSPFRSEEQTSELQSLMSISNAVFCLKKQMTIKTQKE